MLEKNVYLPKLRVSPVLKVRVVIPRGTASAANGYSIHLVVLSLVRLTDQIC